MKKLLLTCMAAALLLAPAGAQAARFGAFVGPGFGWGYGPYWGPYPYGFYGGYYYGPPTGTVKLDTRVKDAQVFINGAYAGTAGHLKTLHLRPGSYDLELRASGNMHYTERIYVVAGKTLHVNPDLPNQTRQ